MSTVISADRRRDLGLVYWQTRYELRAFARNRGRTLFIFMFPLMFLVIFASLDKSGHIARRGNIAYDDFFVPGILAYAVISTTFTNMAISTAILRDQGVLKRMQGTPLPRWAYVAARICSTAVIVVLMSVITLALGNIAYGVPIRAATVPAVALALILGTAAFTTLGIGIVRFISNSDTAPAVVNLAMLPLSFISGIFFVTDGMPKVLRDIANIFPVHALADALQYAFDPRTTGAGFKGADLRTLLIWLAVGIYLMVRFLRKPLGDVK
jgi:ABC-2 type transport system permease protein